jgi:DNA-directed RNA polymerase specialized sigma24 family protein
MPVQDSPAAWDYPVVSEQIRERFDRIMREHGTGLNRAARSYARTDADAQDLAQELGLAIWGALPRFRGECSERTFVYRIAHNRGVNHLWRRRPRRSSSWICSGGG